MFFYVFIIIIVLIIILASLKIRINVENLKISMQEQIDRKANENYKVIISLSVFNRINVLKSEITKDKLVNLQLKKRLKKVKVNNVKISNFDKNKLRKINKYKPNIKYINLVINIGLDDAVLTSYSVATLSGIFGIILKNTIEQSKTSKFIVNPIYSNKNLLDLELNCIIDIKMIHIIYIIYILNKKRRDDKYVRTSNRRAYGYSYE